MADSLRLQVLKALKAALEQINGPVGGFVYNVTHESMVTLDPTVNLMTVNNVDLPMFVVEPTPDGNRDFHPAMQVRDVFRVNVHARADADEANPMARAQVWEDLAADVERALAANVTLDSLVYDCRCLQPAPFVGVGSPVVIVVIPLEIRFHRTYGAP